MILTPPGVGGWGVEWGRWGVAQWFKSVWGFKSEDPGFDPTGQGETGRQFFFCLSESTLVLACLYSPPPPTPHPHPHHPSHFVALIIMTIAFDWALKTNYLSICLSKCPHSTSYKQASAGCGGQCVVSVLLVCCQCVVSAMHCMLAVIVAGAVV